MRTTRIRLCSPISDEDDVDEEPSSSASAGGFDEVSVRAGMFESLEDMASSDMGRSVLVTIHELCFISTLNPNWLRRWHCKSWNCVCTRGPD